MDSFSQFLVVFPYVLMFGLPSSLIYHIHKRLTFIMPMGVAWRFFFICDTFSQRQVLYLFGDERDYIDFAVSFTFLFKISFSLF